MCTISKKTVVRANNASMQQRRPGITAATSKDSVRVSFIAWGTTQHRVISTKELNQAYAKALKSK